AGLQNPLKLLDVLGGATPSLDWSLYCGALPLAFAIGAILTSDRGSVLRLAVALLVALLTLGGVLALFRVEPAPPARVPLFRLLLIFFAGAGFQRLLSEPRRDAARIGGGILLAGSLLLVLASWAAALKPEPLRDVLRLMVQEEAPASTASATLQP